MTYNSNQLQYFLRKAITLASTYEDQVSGLSVLGDYLTEDIANDWMDNDIDELLLLATQKAIPVKAVNIYIQINCNFTKVSAGSEGFEPEIWTLTGLRNHPFWTSQRRLANDFINALLLSAN